MLFRSVRNALEQQHGGHKTLDEMFGGETRGLIGLANDRLHSADDDDCFYYLYQ